MTRNLGLFSAISEPPFYRVGISKQLGREGSYHPFGDLF